MIVNGVPVRITAPAETVAECVKYRNKIGADVDVEARRTCLRGFGDRLSTISGAIPGRITSRQ